MDNNEGAYRSFQEWYLKVTKLEQKMDFIASQYDVNYGQYLIMKYIIVDHCDEPTLLANAFGISRPAVSRKLNVLYKKNKIVKKHNDPTDQRKVHLVLTAEGKSDLAAMDLGYLQWFGEEFMTNQAVDLAVLQEQTDHVLNQIPSR
ncbi:MarR family winged helix-turn-helix transcriptional regulator [Latilactobacillus fuchuensis]|uniref:HTH marR-type domain-containing protein n=1 Tax=Latilactobacillus fuchuensis DSM 14340 = JCM 11249 TaxID=1423747 RepID=A0A0R1RXK5_9LACO|nr:MarR family transcriptional regulator [Latilactobacillus fuchuensis]KRL59162.1 hypothetical protein FC69_GL001788 [Latilactobacillus fuchuensis DSM 14340 = JCM 11249]